MTHTLHMVDCDVNRRVQVVVGIRRAREVLGDELGSTLQRSVATVDQFKANGQQPVLIGRHADLSLVHKAARALEADSVGGAKAAIDLTPEQVFDATLRTPANGVPEDEGDETFSAESYATALVLMALTGGNPNGALAAANALMHTADVEFFDEVGDVLLDTFPGQRA
jgi:hypothetical protein